MTKKFLLVALALTAIFSCRQAPSTELQTRKFPVLQIPGVITQEAEVLEYASLHLWDAFADTSALWLNDSLHIAGVPVVDIEQNLSSYCEAVSKLPENVRWQAVEALYNNICKFRPGEAYEKMLELVERYMYDPNSPVRDEELYLPFVSALEKDESLSEAERGAYTFTKEMCSLNRTGRKAADFSFSDKNGRIYKLSGIKADYTLLFFSNPGCTACKNIIEYLRDDPATSEMIESGKLAVVNIYIDEDIEAWMGYMSFYPDNWYNGYDHNGIIRGDTLYNVRAIPSLYLLDSEKRVILKDAPENRVFEFLSGISL